MSRNSHAAHLIWVLAIVVAWGEPRAASAATPTADEREAIGLTALQNALGEAAPDGSGVTVSQVEAPRSASESEYYVNVALADFAGKTITPKYTPATTSTHATNMAQNIYGSGGVAPGVNVVDVYQSNEWIGNGFLRSESALAPRIETRDVQNHSWIGEFSVNGVPDTARAEDVLRRMDYVVTRDRVVAVAGVNNGSNTVIPQVLANAYNVIAVGRTDGNSSRGGSTLDGIGRSKPDIVAPGYNVSVATAWVSGAAAILLDAGNGSETATRPETIKALLLAGASKAPFDVYNDTPTTDDDWTRTTTRPLDLTYGAGQLDINTSYHILAAGEQGPGNVNLLPQGWDATTIAGGTEQQYFINIPSNYVLLDFSTVAAWNREIDFQAGVGPIAATLTPSLANVDLHLNNSDNFSLGSLVDESVSTIDNVEHIYRIGLVGGQYALTLESDSTTDVTLAWTGKLVLAGDANFDGVVDGIDYITWATNYKSQGAKFSEGDFNLDGVVDGIDYIAWAQNFSGANAAAFPAVPVPEPSSLALALSALAGGALALRLRRRK